MLQYQKLFHSRSFIIVRIVERIRQQLEDKADNKTSQETHSFSMHQRTSSKNFQNIHESSYKAPGALKMFLYISLILRLSINQRVVYSTSLSFLGGSSAFCRSYNVFH